MDKVKAGLFSTLIILLLLGACSPLRTPATEQTAPGPATVKESETPSETDTAAPDLPGDSAGVLHSVEYQLGLLDQIQVVQLADGRYQEGVPGNDDYISVFVTDHIAHGDLNGDGEDEVVALVTEVYGNTGSFVFLAVFEYRNETPVFVTSIYLDDQPLINELAVDDGEIFVDAAVHARDDPTCCPSMATMRHYWLNGINLILMDYSTRTPAGDPRTITIEAPVDGAQVSGVVRLKGNVSVAPFENNLVYRIHDLGGVELTVGPVNVEAAELGAPGTFEKAVDLGNILTNTTVRITVEDINMADGSLFALDSVILQIR